MLILVLSTIVQLSIQQNDSLCDYRIRPTAEGGVGLFAVRELQENFALEIGIGIPLPMPVIFWNELLNYAEGFNETHALIPLGNGILLNHHLYLREINVQKLPSGYAPQMTFSQNPLSQSSDILYEYMQQVAKGSQLLVDYGHDWFEDRNQQAVDLLHTPSNSIPRDSEVGLQGDTERLSDNNVFNQLLPTCPHQWTRLTNNEVYAAADIPQGTIIELTRAILFPVSRALLTSGPLESVIWWLTSPTMLLEEEQSSGGFVERFQRVSTPYVIAPFNRTLPYAMLLSGRGPFYGDKSSAAVSRGDESVSLMDKVDGNVEMKWWQWGKPPHGNGGEVDVLPECNNLMMAIIVATRTIEKGEKLSLSFTRDIKRQRRYLDSDLISRCQ